MPQSNVPSIYGPQPNPYWTSQPPPQSDETDNPQMRADLETATANLYKQLEGFENAYRSLVGNEPLSSALQNQANSVRAPAGYSDKYENQANSSPQLPRAPATTSGGVKLNPNLGNIGTMPTAPNPNSGANAITQPNIPASACNPNDATCRGQNTAAPQPIPGTFYCYAPGVKWNCDVGLRCGRMPGTCTR